MNDAKPICVFTLHRVTEVRSQDHDLSWTSFRRFLADVSQAAGEVVSDFEPSSTKPRIVLTFDDATDDHEAAGEELRAAELTGMFFVPTATIDKPGHLTAGDVVELARAGHTIGSHSDRHVPLASLTADELEREIVRSSERLADLLGDPPRYFAPPGGVGHPDLRPALQRHGFVASRSMRWGIHTPGADVWDIPCVPVTEVTLARGWVHAALSSWQLPGAMRAAWLLKSGLPRPFSRAVRHALHGAAR